MIPIDASAEKSVIERLQSTGPCSLDDLVMQLPNLNWNVVFVARSDFTGRPIVASPPHRRYEERIMLIWERWIRLGVLFGLLLGWLGGCSTITRPPDDCPIIPSPPVGLIANGDHYALEDWYKNEAALLRLHAKDLEVTLEEYRKNPSIARDAKGNWHTLDLESQFAGMIKVYGSAAEEADRLAQWHNHMSIGTLKHNDPLNQMDPTSSMDVQPY